MELTVLYEMKATEDIYHSNKWSNVMGLDGRGWPSFFRLLLWDIYDQLHEPLYSPVLYFAELSPTITAFVSFLNIQKTI